MPHTSECKTPFGAFVLSRLPERHHDSLQAWDAADMYLLSFAAERLSAEGGQVVEGLPRVLLYNDTFGALGVALHEQEVTSCSDSYVSHAATRLNLEQNGLPVDAVSYQDSLTPLEGVFDLVLMRLPKTLDLWFHQLQGLKSHLHEGSIVVAGGMVKWIVPQMWQLMEEHLGETKPSRAVKKARLIQVQLDPEKLVATSEQPAALGGYDVSFAGRTLSMCGYANVFSKDRLDPGARFFLAHLPHLETANHILDLGCGNGVLGVAAGCSHPDTHVTFVDESYMAVASSRINWENAFGGEREADFLVAHDLSDVNFASFDLVLCNPPFHQLHSVGDHVAKQMFRDARRVLCQDGQCWVVGNRHLNYHVLLKEHFSSVQVVGGHKKFVLLQATGPRPL